MDQHQRFLANRLLSQEQPVSYRMLSRVLHVHVNSAKRILYDFYKQQNSLRAASVHATYLVYGTRKNGGEPLDSSLPDAESDSVSTKPPTLALVAEDRLDEVLQEYQQLSYIHVYSLAPHPRQDVTPLAELDDSSAEHSSDAASLCKYGVIVNPAMRKRHGASRPAASTLKEEAPVKLVPAERVREEIAANTLRSRQRPSSSTIKSAAPAPKPRAPGGIMQSFAAKAAAKPPPAQPKPTVKPDDVDMARSDDAEAGESDVLPSRGATNAAEPAGKIRKEREEELKRMMEDDKAEEELQRDDEFDRHKGNQDQAQDVEMEDAPEPEAVAEPADTGIDAQPAEEVATCSNGRRRGRRRIMKKKRILDDQGYMVTLQEPGWESFSEDDTQKEPASKTPASTPSISAESKTKKAPGKEAQGNIMSFFAKK